MLNLKDCLVRECELNFFFGVVVRSDKCDIK